MRPERAAQVMAEAGALLLVLLLVLRGLSAADSLSNPLALDTGPVLQPILQDYIFSDTGQSITFMLGVNPSGAPGQQAVAPVWYTARLRDGLPFPTEKPPGEDIRPFVLRNNQLFLLVGNGDSLATGSPNGTLVGVTSLSPNREWMAFSAARNGGPAGLYILSTGEDRAWLGEEAEIGDLAWSPDNLNLAYTAPRDGVFQVFTIDREGQNLVQVSMDPAPKSSPVWLVDGKGLAYVAEQAGEAPDSAQPGGEPETTSAVFITRLDGAPPVQVASGLPAGTRIQIVPVAGQIAYPMPIPGQPRLNALYLIDPSTGQTRRAYPPLAVEAVECPPSLQGTRPTSLKITLSNTSLQPASLPLVLRVSPEPLPVTGDRTTSAARIESIDLAAGETRQIEWQVQSAPGLSTYISILVNLVEFYPMSELNCRVPNTYLGLPRLTYLPVTLPLLVPGLLLLLPWLRHKKIAWLWALIPIYLTVLVGLIAVEIQIVASQGL